MSAPSVATQRVREGTVDIAVCFSIAPEKEINVHYSQRAPIYVVHGRLHKPSGRRY